MPTDVLVLMAAVCASLETLNYLLQRLPSKMRNSPRLAKTASAPGRGATLLALT